MKRKVIKHRTKARWLGYCRDCFNLCRYCNGIRLAHEVDDGQGIDADSTDGSSHAQAQEPDMGTATAGEATASTSLAVVADV